MRWARASTGRFYLIGGDGTGFASRVGGRPRRVPREVLGRVLGPEGTGGGEGGQEPGGGLVVVWRGAGDPKGG